jgi:hypothetical protein
VSGASFHKEKKKKREAHIYMASIDRSLLSWVLAAPVLPQPNRTVEKRATEPQIDIDSVQETQQLQDGVFIAMELASIVCDPSCNHIEDQIFPKYFPTSEKATVDGTSLLSLSIKMPIEIICRYD